MASIPNALIGLVLLAVIRSSLIGGQTVLSSVPQLVGNDHHACAEIPTVSRYKQSSERRNS